MHDLLARQMFGQGTASRLSGRLLDGRAHMHWPLCEARLQILDRQLHLRELAIELLGGAAVLLALEARDLKAQLLELEFLGKHERFGDFQLRAALGEGGIALDENAL